MRIFAEERYGISHEAGSQAGRIGHRFFEKGCIQGPRLDVLHDHGFQIYNVSLDYLDRLLIRKAR